jgi:large subunit ribosomal protein L23
MNLENIILKPIMSEKASKLTEKRNVYCFQVGIKANKNQVRAAIESFYNVKVEAINTSITPGKVVRTSKGVKKSPKWKKAYVVIAQDQKIKLFEGI